MIPPHNTTTAPGPHATLVGAWCWCDPAVAFVPDDDGTRHLVVVHYDPQPYAWRHRGNPPA